MVAVGRATVYHGALRRCQMAIRKGILVLCLFALGCDAKPAGPPARPEEAPRTAAARCPVCGTPIGLDRAVTASGGVAVCSQGCAIRYEVGQAPPPATTTSRAGGSATSETDEDR